jgi:putative holliday junction resolvase
MARVLALDIGTRRIGVAVSDEMGILAQPLQVIERKGIAWDVAQVAGLVQAHGAQAIVVGMPYTLRGEQASAAEQLHSFLAALREATPVPVIPVDERFSTVEADRRMREASVRREQRRRRVDAVAAALILERYLNQRRNGANGADSETA